MHSKRADKRKAQHHSHDPYIEDPEGVLVLYFFPDVQIIFLKKEIVRKTQEDRETRYCGCW